VLILNAGEYLFSTGKNVWVVGMFAVEVSDDLSSFLDTSVGDEPSRRLW
jgi:hypothetical protein